eukprot:3924764-Amphidinium_carterae.1
MGLNNESCAQWAFSPFANSGSNSDEMQHWCSSRGTLSWQLGRLWLMTPLGALLSMRNQNCSD